MPCFFKGADSLSKKNSTFAVNKNLEVFDIRSKPKMALFQEGENDEPKTPLAIDTGYK